GARHPEAPVAAAGGDEDSVVGQAVAVVELHDALGGIDARGPDAEARLDPVLLPEAGRPDQRVVERALAAQVLLGERGPLVGRAGLLPDEHDLTLESLVAEHG